MRHTVALLLVACAMGLGVAACGGDDEAAPTTTEETTAVGREVFIADCGSCHALSDAGTSGDIGPALDGAGYSANQVEQQVRSGGGVMPAFEGVLSEEEIQEVSVYVAAASGG
jgi:mono/diheme cytochrome c family protein